MGAVYVPNYVPEPLEVPGNVTLEPYRLRMVFIRRVGLLHSASLVIVALASGLPWPAVDWTWMLLAIAGAFIALDVMRIAIRGRSLEARLSAWALVPLLVLVGWAAREVSGLGFPLWAALVGPCCALIYTILCGRDFSFVGCFFLSLISSSVAVAGLTQLVQPERRSSTWALAVNAVYLTYVIYDWASLMSRRRRGEELAAVMDLYRDVFNIFGYVVRVIGHWRKHRIWNLPWEPDTLAFLRTKKR